MTDDPGVTRRSLPATRRFAPPPQQANPSVPYGYAQPPFLLTPAKPSSGLAVWSLILGLVGFFAGWCLLGIPCLAAVIVGHLAVADTKNDAKSGRGMAVAGLALGYVAIAPAVILFFWIVMGGLMGAAVPEPTYTP